MDEPMADPKDGPKDEPERPRDPRLIALALRVVDDAPVDWEEARQTTGDLGSTVERLREIQRVAARHQAPPAREAGEAGTAAVAFVWGRLRALEKLGSGGFGEVWRAWDPALEREVALKLRHAGDPGGSARWLREAQSLARVHHPNVVAVHGAAVHDGRAGLWTDLVRGLTLEQVLRAIGPLGAREAAAIGLDLCAALASVHATGLAHGDVKTANVMREGVPDADGRSERAGRIVLMDFGTAHEQDPAGTRDSPSAGTPLYTAPELLAGAGGPTIAGDLYALGVLLYRLVTARFPVEADSLDALRGKLARRELAPLRARRPDVPIGFVQVVERALEHEPERRFANAAEMERALAAVLGETASRVAPRAATRTTLLLGLAAGAALVALAWLGTLWLPAWLKPRFALASGGPRIVSDARVTLNGGHPYARFGGSVCAPGDLDGDGRTDLVIAAKGEDDGRGLITVFHGLADGSFGRPRELRYSGDVFNFGHVVVAVGDVNGDGRPDFAAGAPSEAAAGRGAGDVLLYYGGSQGPAPDRIVHGTRANQDFGYAVAGGDLDGDGIAELIVGAPIDDAAGRPTGRVLVYKGTKQGPAAAPLELATVVPDAQFGYSVAVIGDLNGDGYADLAVGAHWDASDGVRAGRVYVYFGGRTLHAEPDLVIPSPQVGAWFGTTVLGAGDLNGDGFADLVVSGSEADGFEPGSGAVWVYFGGRRPRTTPALFLRGPRTGARFGEQLASADLDADGTPDLLVTAPTLARGGDESGALYAFAGGPRLSDRPGLEVDGPAGSHAFGWGLAALPRPSAGALASAIVGAPATDVSGARAGSASIVDFERFVLTRPAYGERWPGGGRATLSWLGSDPARVEVRWDDAATFTTLAARAGGEEHNSLSIAVPAGVHWAQVRISDADPGKPGAAIGSRVPIGSTP
jgi:hypothetical protein